MSRPSGYDKDFHPKNLLELMTQGMLDCEIYSTWKIGKATFYRWVDQYSELKEAHEEGKEQAEAWWVKRMREAFLDRDDKGFKYCIAIMNNKFGWDKGGKGEGNTTNISIGNMNVLNTKSESELLEILQSKYNEINRLNSVEVIEIKPDDHE